MIILHFHLQPQFKYELFHILHIKAYFVMYTAYKKCSYDLQKKLLDRFNFKTKVIDNTPKYILHTRCLVRPPDDNINQPNSDWKGGALDSPVFITFSSLYIKIQEFKWESFNFESLE